jgi:hypothetical protein
MKFVCVTPSEAGLLYKYFDELYKTKTSEIVHYYQDRLLK